MSRYIKIYVNIGGGVGPRLFAMIALEIYGVGLANSPSTPHPIITGGDNISPNQAEKTNTQDRITFN